MEVRDTDVTTNVQRTLFPWGVGVAILLTGESIADQQSNGSGWADTASTDYDSSVFNPDLQKTSIIKMNDAWVNGTSYSVDDLVCDTDDNTLWKCETNHTAAGSGTFAADRTANPSYWTQVNISEFQVDTINATSGAIMHTIDRVRKYENVPCMAVFGAKTGSKLVGGGNEWDNYSDDVTHGKLQAVIANTESDFEFLLWLQGANDANSATPPTEAAYQSALEAVIPQIRSYITGRSAANMPAIIPTAGTNTSGSSPVDSGWRAVRNGILGAIPNITNAHSLEMYDLSHADALHPDTDGYIRLNKRQAQTILHILDSATYTNDVEGSVVASAVRGGGDTYVDVTFTLNNGTTLEGLTADTGLTGFRILRGGTPQTITGAAVQSANVIRLTASVQAGDVVDYIDIQNPVITNNVYTDASVIGDSAGVPVKPFEEGITV